MSTINDTFHRANGPLGTEPGGLPWSVLAGAATIASNQAAVTVGNGAESGRSIAILPLAGDGTFTLTLPGTPVGGECLYFRVSDTNNWWRLRAYAQTGSYQYVADYTCTDTFPSGGVDVGPHGGTYHSSTDTSGSYGSYNTSCSPNYATNYYTAYTIYLDKCVAGTVTSTALGSLSARPVLGVTCSGSSIVATDGTNTQAPITDTFGQTAIGVGIGTGPSSNYSSTEYVASLTATYQRAGDSAGSVLVG